MAEQVQQHDSVHSTVGMVADGDEGTVTGQGVKPGRISYLIIGNTAGLQHLQRKVGRVEGRISVIYVVETLYFQCI